MQCAVCNEKVSGIAYISDCGRVCHVTCVKIIDYGQCTRPGDTVTCPIQL